MYLYLYLFLACYSHASLALSIPNTYTIKNGNAMTPMKPPGKYEIPDALCKRGFNCFTVQKSAKKQMISLKEESELIAEIKSNPTSPANEMKIKKYKDFLKSEKKDSELQEFLDELNKLKIKTIKNSRGKLKYPFTLTVNNIDYKIIQHLETGSSGVALDVKSLNGPAVMKIYYKRNMENYDREIYALGVTKMLIGNDLDNLINIQRKIEGITLADKLQKLDPINDRLTIAELKSKYDSIGDIFTNEFKLIHGDIRPANIIVNEKNQKMTLIDFEHTIKKPDSYDAYQVQRNIQQKYSESEWEFALIYNKIKKIIEKPSLERESLEMNQLNDFLVILESRGQTGAGLKIWSDYQKNLRKLKKKELENQLRSQMNS